MEYDYCAFISYHHNPHDMKVASNIQKRIERFIIPASIQKKTGKKKIGKVFRDKEELGITHDLNEDIKNALTHSQYLIVICSTEMTQSVWVPKEISYFLETHDQDNVLTVITDGEPNDVIPLILKEKIETVDGQQVKTIIEPLSCDFRVTSYFEKEREFQRLIAALLGVHFDDIARRLQRRKRRIIGLIGLAAMCLISYLSWSNTTISKNYNNALINESKYLSKESLKALDKNDNLLGATLALNALPTYKNRPLIPEAKYALTESIGAYMMASPTSYGITKKLTPKNGDTVMSINLTSDGKILSIYDYGNHLSFWDTATGKCIKTLKTSITSDPVYLKNDKLLAYDYYKLYCIDMHSGNEIWHQSFNLIMNVIVIEDRFAVIASVSGHPRMYICDSTGNIINHIDLPKDCSVQDKYISTKSNHTHIYLLMKDDKKNYLIGDCDLKTYSIKTKSIKGISDARRICIVKDKFYIMDHYSVICIDQETFKKERTYQLKVNGSFPYINGFLIFTWNKEVKLLIYANGNAALVDASTGKQEKRYTFEGTIISSEIEDEKDLIKVYTSRGCEIIFNIKNGKTDGGYRQNYKANTKDILIYQKDDHIYKYVISDDGVYCTANYFGMQEDKPLFKLPDKTYELYFCDNYFVSTDYNNNLYITDTKAYKTKKVDGEYSLFKYLGYYDDYCVFSFYDHTSKYPLYRVHLKDGKTECISDKISELIKEKTGDGSVNWAYDDKNFCMSGSSLYFFLKTYYGSYKDDLYLCKYDMKNEKLEIIDYHIDKEYYLNMLTVDKKERYLLTGYTKSYYDNTPQLQLYDLKNNKKKNLKVPQENQTTYYSSLYGARFNEKNNRVACCFKSNDYIFIYDTNNGHLVHKISLNQRNLNNITYYGNELVLDYGSPNNYIECIVKEDYDHPIRFSNNNSSAYSFSGGKAKRDGDKLIIEGNYSTGVIDMKNHNVEAIIDGGIFYDTNKKLIYVKDNGSIYAYKYLSVDELIEQGKDFIANYELNESQAAEYGIDDQ